MSPRIKAGRAWAINVSVLWLFMGSARAAAAIGLSLYLQDFSTLGNELAQALVVAVGGPLMTSPVAFGLGYLGGKAERSWFERDPGKSEPKEVISNPGAWGVNKE